MKRKQLLLVFCLLACCHGKAQQRVAYSYDASGNRVERYVVTAQTKAKSKSVDVTGVLKKTWSDKGNVKVCADPVSDNLTITFWQLPDKDMECLVCDYGGVVVLKKSLHEVNTVLDMSGWNSGVYLLRIRGASESNTWKIVKR